MTSADWEILARYVPEIILVVLFMGYSYLRDQAYLKAQSDQQAALSAERVRRAEINSSERKERDKDWQAFLVEERKFRSDWNLQAQGQLTQMATLISTTNQLIVQHDTWERAVVQNGNNNNKG